MCSVNFKAPESSTGAKVTPAGYTNTGDAPLKGTAQPASKLPAIPPPPNPFAMFGFRIPTQKTQAGAGEQGRTTGVSDLRIPRG